MIMSTLKSRLEKLEKSVPIKNPLADLTIEELNEEMFLLCQRQYDSGIQPDLKTVITNLKCKQFYKEGTPWVMNRNHRLSVFLKFKQILLKLEIPNKERIEALLNLGWRGVKINPDEIDWLEKELIDIDMGEEKLWLRGYLEYSGQSTNF